MHELTKDTTSNFSKRKDDLEIVWNSNFNLIVDFFNENGHLAHLDKSLKSWLIKQVALYRKNLLYPQRKKKFDDFDLHKKYEKTMHKKEVYTTKIDNNSTIITSRKKDDLEKLWNIKLDTTISSFNDNGHFAYLDESLKVWLSKQIMYYERNLLPSLRKKKFDDSNLYFHYKKTKHINRHYLLKLNFDNVSDSIFQDNDLDLFWNQRLDEVICYFENNGHFYGMDSCLKSWLKEQVYEYNRRSMLPQRVEKINRANLVNHYLNTKIINGLWIKKYRALEMYINCNSFNDSISRDVVCDNLKIGDWICTQKELLSSSKLCEEIQELFNKIGFKFTWVK